MLFVFGVIVALLMTAFVDNPGYMDAEYYFYGGQRIASGYGFSEMILWNYLDDPDGIPHPSHGYWMPLTSMLTALGMIVFGNTSFNAGRTSFLLIAGLIPVVTGALAYSFTYRKSSAFLGGSLAALSGFYVPFMVTTDSFGIYALIGGLIMLILGLHSKGGGQRNRHFVSFKFLILGMMTGLMFLTRTDGFIWFMVLVAFIIGNQMKKNGQNLGTRHKYQTNIWMRFPWIGAELLFLVVGFIVIIAPWIYRNLSVYNAPFSPGGWRILWLTTYDEIFTFPATNLSFTHWIASGLSKILQARIWALGQNLQTTLAVQGMIFILPLILIGMWESRQDTRVWIGGSIWVFVFILMTFILPFVGARGGFFHAGAALSPFFLAMVPIGLERFIQWGERIRKWKPEKARLGFSILLILSALFFTTAVVYIRVIGIASDEIAWESEQKFYHRADQYLITHGIQPEEIILVINPPGYIVATGRSAIAIPEGDENTLVDVAQQHHATYIILEPNHPKGLELLYTSPADRALIKYLGTYEDARIYKIG